MFGLQSKAITRHGVPPRHPLYKEGFRFFKVYASEASFGKEVPSIARRKIAPRSVSDLMQSPVTALTPCHPLYKEGFRDSDII